jgi:photoactive yellow protein
MLDLQSVSSTRVPFEPASLDALGDAELDALSFGVIALDELGIVRRYNLYESRLARLDRRQVVGKDFFRDVARCARGERFEGRFRRLAASEAGAREAERFPFTFDFAFGAQEVAVEMVRAPSSRYVYLLINRSRVAPPRPDFPREELGTLQAALAPDEALLGVRRDPLERRVVEIEWSVLSALRATCDRLAPESWTLFCTEWGVAWGRRLAVDLETLAIERHAQSLRELPMRVVSDLLSEQLRSRGWGRLELDFADASRGLVAMRVERSALAESTRASGRSTVAAAFSCPLLAGCLGAVLSHVAQRKLTVREVACAAHGAACCELVAVGPALREALDAAIASGTRGIADAAAVLLVGDAREEA